MSKTCAYTVPSKGIILPLTNGARNGDCNGPVDIVYRRYHTNAQCPQSNSVPAKPLESNSVSAKPLEANSVSAKPLESNGSVSAKPLESVSAN